MQMTKRGRGGELTVTKPSEVIKGFMGRPSASAKKREDVNTIRALNEFFILRRKLAPRSCSFPVLCCLLMLDRAAYTHVTICWTRMETATIQATSTACERESEGETGQNREGQ